jgi:hypothetical protein
MNTFILLNYLDNLMFLVIVKKEAYSIPNQAIMIMGLLCNL